MRWAMFLAAGIAAVLLASTMAISGQPPVVSSAAGQVATGSTAAILPDATATATNLIYLPHLPNNGDLNAVPTVTPTPAVSPTPTAVPTNTIGSSFPPSITLDLSSSGVNTGGVITLTWRVGAQAEGHALLLAAREPGPPYTSTGTLLMPGMPAATGSQYYLKPDLTWITTTETVFLSPSVSGSVAITLPTASEGEWQVEALLRNLASGETDAFDAHPLLASPYNQETILLRLNRPIANTGDRMRAELLTTASEYQRQVKITAWLEKPDGGELSLPGPDPRPGYASWDNATNSKLTLLDQDLSAFGAGDYKIEARAYYSDSNSLFGYAAAGFSVCDTPGAVSGSVYAASRSPLGGGAQLASVRAFDIDDGATTASTSIDASGAYSMTLKPGRYLLSAFVLDGAGFHSAKDLTPLKIGCGGLGASRNLTAAAPTGLSAALTAGSGPISFGTRGRALAAASGPIPNPAAFGSYLIGGGAVSNGVAASISERFFTLLGNNNPQVDLTMWSEVAAVLNWALLQQQFDAGAIDVTEVAGALNKRFAITLEFDNKAGIKTVTVNVLDALHGDILYRRNQQVTGATDRGWLDATDTFAADLGTSLYQILDNARDRPILPRLTMGVAPSEVQPGGFVTVTGTLKDADGTAASGKTVNLAHQRPVGAETLALTTDTAGAYQTQLAVGDVSGQGLLDASFIGRDQQRSNPRHESYRVVGSPDLTLASTRVRLSTDETAPVCATLKKDGSPMAGAVVTMTSRLGGLDPRTVTTGADGQGCSTYTAYSRSGPENITAVATQVVTSTVVTAGASLPLTIDGRASLYLSAARTTVSDGSLTSVSADIRIGNYPAGGVPIQFSVSGNGSLSTAATQTNSWGQATVYYLAPSAGEGTAVLTGVAMVEGVGYTQTLTLTYRPAACVVGPGVPQCYDVTVLTTSGDGGSAFQALRLKNDGTILGSTSTYANGITTKYLATWQNGTVITGSVLPALGGSSYVSDIADVNDSGVAVGQVVSVTTNYAVKWQNGNAYKLISGGLSTSVSGVNTGGDAVGSYGGPYDFWPIIWPGTNLPNSGVITGTTVYYGLGGWGGGSAEGYFFDINNSGTVAAQFAYTTTSSPGFALWAAATWNSTSGSVVQIGTLGGNTSQPAYVNDSGYVVGWSRTGSEKIHGFLWKGATITDLGALPGSGDDSSAYSVNSSGNVVGLSGNSRFLYRNGVMYDLDRLVDLADSGNYSGTACSINDSGWILVGDHLLKPK